MTRCKQCADPIVFFYDVARQCWVPFDPKPIPSGAHPPGRWYRVENNRTAWKPPALTASLIDRTGQSLEAATDEASGFPAHKPHVCRHINQEGTE